MNATPNAPETHTSIASEMMDAWFASYKTAIWSQEQLEHLTQGWMSQARTMRNDGEKVMEALFTQAKTNADEMTRATETVMHQAMARVPGWDNLTAADLRRQVADLNARVDALAAR